MLKRGQLRGASMRSSCGQMKEGEAAGVQATPSLYFNGRPCLHSCPSRPSSWSSARRTRKSGSRTTARGPKQLIRSMPVLARRHGSCSPGASALGRRCAKTQSRRGAAASARHRARRRSRGDAAQRSAELPAPGSAHWRSAWRGRTTSSARGRWPKATSPGPARPARTTPRRTALQHGPRRARCASRRRCRNSSRAASRSGIGQLLGGQGLARVGTRCGAASSTRWCEISWGAGQPESGTSLPCAGWRRRSRRRSFRWTPKGMLLDGLRRLDEMELYRTRRPFTAACRSRPKKLVDRQVHARRAAGPRVVRRAARRSRTSPRSPPSAKFEATKPSSS